MMKNYKAIPFDIESGKIKIAFADIANNQDNIKSELLNKIQKIEKKYEIKYISKLVSNISNVVDDNNGENKAKEILNKSTINFNEVKEDTKKYYQYTQFKKAYFNCTNRAYDQNTGRIVSMTFEFVKIGD